MTNIKDFGPVSGFKGGLGFPAAATTATAKKPADVGMPTSRRKLASPAFHLVHHHVQSNG